MNNKIENQIFFEITENLKEVSNAIGEYTKAIEYASSTCKSFEVTASKSFLDMSKEVVTFTNSTLGIISNLRNLKLTTYAATFAQTAYTKTVSFSTNLINTYQQGVSTARAAITATTGATKAMNIAIAASPYLIAAAAAAALGVAIYKLAVGNSDAAKVQERLDEAMTDMNKEVSTEKLSLDTLFGSLFRAKEGTEEWNRAKDKIQEKYGDYLTQLGIEITNVDTARKAYGKLSAAILENARARARDRALTSAGDALAENEAGDLTKMRKVLTKEYGEQTGSRIFEGIAASIRRGDKEIPERWKQFVNKLDRTVTQSYGTAGQTTSYVDNPLTPYIYSMQCARKNYEEEIKRINAVLGTPLQNTNTDTPPKKTPVLNNPQQQEPAEKGSIAAMKSELAELEKSLSNTTVGTASVDIKLKIDNLKKQIESAEYWIEREAFKKEHGEITIPMDFTIAGGNIYDMAMRFQNEAMEKDRGMKPTMLTGETSDGLKLPEPELPNIEKPLSNMERWNKTVDEMKEKNINMIDGLGSMGTAMGSIGDLIGGAAGQWLDWGANCMQAIAAAIPQIMALCTAQGAQATANTTTAATGAASAMSSIPIVGPVLAIAAVASVLAALASIPKFAMGGIAYGPTLGLFGEYSGAQNNPEVVAPLNRLRAMLQPTGDFGGEVNFRIRDRYLEGILQKRNNRIRRTH